MTQIKLNSNSKLYVAQIDPSSGSAESYVIYVHGGPGNHSAYFEEFIKTEKSYQESSIGWIVYDQRGCGRSKGYDEEDLTHPNNVEDLKDLVEELSKDKKISAIVGHSYGAWLVYEYIEKYGNTIPAVLVGMASKIGLPKNRSLSMDLQILKQSQAEDYLDVIGQIDDYAENLWKMAKLVRQKMKSPELRKHYYWGCPQTMRLYDELKASVTVKEDDKVFRIVRATLYQNEQDMSGPHTEPLGDKYLWINGFHDYLMGGEFLDADNKGITTFFKSGHYPHFEEPEHFVKILSQFILS